MSSVDDRLQGSGLVMVLLAVVGVVIAGSGVYVASTMRTTTAAPQDMVADLQQPEAKVDLVLSAETPTARQPQELTIPFGLNQADEAITPDIVKKVQALAMTCSSSLEVIGHTCTLGPPELNDGIARGRAEAAAAILSKMGVPTDRMTIRSAGSSAPVGDNATPEGRAQNRRVTLTCQ